MVLVRSSAAAKKICDILGCHAPVNYVAAMKLVVYSLSSCSAPPLIYSPTFSQG